MCNTFLAAYSTNKIISFPNSEMPTYATTSRWTTCTTHDIYMFIKDGMGHIFWKSRQSRHSCLGWENVTSDVQHIAAHMHKVEADIAMDAKISFNLLWSGLANRCRRGGSASGFQSSDRSLSLGASCDAVRGCWKMSLYIHVLGVSTK